MKQVHYQTGVRRTVGRPSMLGRSVRAHTAIDTACGLGARSARKATEDWAQVTCRYCLKRKP